MLANSESSLGFLTCDEWAIEPTTTSLDVSKKSLNKADGTLLAGVMKGNAKWLPGVRELVTEGKFN